MLDFLKKITEWILQKEEELAKDCKISIEDIDKQIARVQEKKAEVEKGCKENIQELDRILGRLESIKNIERVKCQRK